MRLSTLFARKLLPVPLSLLLLISFCLLSLCSAGWLRAEEAEKNNKAAAQAGEVDFEGKAAEITSKVNARLEKLEPRPAGDFAVLEITNLDSRDYIFTEFHLHKRVSSPEALNNIKADVRIVAEVLVKELRDMGIKTGEGGAVAVVRLYDAPKAGEGKDSVRLFGTMSCGHVGNDIVWDAVDAN